MTQLSPSPSLLFASPLSAALSFVVRTASRVLWLCRTHVSLLPLALSEKRARRKREAVLGSSIAVALSLSLALSLSCPAQ